ncbi:hypothetical protein DPMN_066585 [Dreissena polymorpha]|uniref:Uncharacterized protein n=1 Tax=Dreissena polymorpha TaxID=45954 RepID=A0A9D3YUB0_DREPO|nr:hypothetical protein DPMN_066585 [Dreissena polymorpha]
MQVLVCGYTSYTVIPMDHEDRKKLATLDGVVYPWSVCYNKYNDPNTVGHYRRNKIIVLELN